MKLAWLVLRGFRRFESADAQLFGHVVALVGPNEAGKSSILHALETLNNADPIEETNLTRGLEIGPEDVVIRARFLLTDNDRAAISDIPGADKLRWFIINKRRDGKFTTSVEPGMDLDLKDRRVAAGMVERLGTTKWAADIQLDAGGPLPEAAMDLQRRLLGDGVLSDEDRSALQAFVEEIRDEALNPPKSALELVRRIEKVLADAPKDHPRDRARNALFGRRPHFATFADDDRSLQSDYDVSALIDDDPPAALKNIATLAGLDLRALKSAVAARNYPKAERPIREANARLEDFFRSSWTQSGITVTFSLHEARLHIFVTVPDGDFTSIRERSDGLRSFVALTTFVAVQDEAKELVLLIDEAETHLHYDAQADLVRVFGLQRAADSIIYTTHSAGCLPEDLGSGIRVVRRTSDTRSDVSNSFWTEGAGFSPLLLGMGASALVFSAVRRAVVAEGATDLILLPALLREATGRRELGYQIAPGVAEVSRSSVKDLELEAALVLYVVDDDEGGRGHADKLAKAGVAKDRILALGRGITRGMAAEDLVTKNVYLKAVNHELSRSGRAKLLTAADIPARGRSLAVRQWAKKHRHSEPKKVNVAQAIALDVELHGPVLTGPGVRVLRAFDERVRSLFGLDDLAPHP